MTRRAIKLAAVAFFALVLSPATVVARERMVPLHHSRIGVAPVVIHDRVLFFRGRPRARAASAPAGSYGGTLYTADGTTVTAYMSPSYVPDQTVLQSVADLFDSFVHGPELANVLIYVAPIDEIHAACGSNTTDSCFAPSSNMILLVGTPPPDGTPVEEIAAHEYGHAIALARSDAWYGSAYWTGPEYWASYENVCNRTQVGTAFPGNEGVHYNQNPGEAWADTNRILNGGLPSLWQFDPSFFPNSTDLRLARRDILQPWTGNVWSEVKGAFHRHRARNQYYTLVTPDDGPNASVQLAAHGSLRNKLYISDAAAGTRIGQSHRAGANQGIPFSICGGRRINIRIYRRSGYGSFRLSAYIP